MHRLVLLLLLPLAVAAADSYAPDQKEQSDLDGDGKAETITLEQPEAEESIFLTVGSARLAIPVRGELGAAEFSVLDIDSGDRAREVMVGQALGDYRKLSVYAYERGQLRKLGELEDRIDAKGNGIVLEHSWQGFWTKHEKYVLAPGRAALRKVPQELYAVDVQVKVTRMFPLLSRRTSDEVVANVAPDSTISIVAAGAGEREGDLDWYLVRTSTGLMGWARFKTLRENTLLPLAG